MGYGVTPVVQPSGAGQAAVTLGNKDGEIGGLTISDPPTQAEVQALQDACEELADIVRLFHNDPDCAGHERPALTYDNTLDKH